MEKIQDRYDEDEDLYRIVWTFDDDEMEDIVDFMHKSLKIEGPAFFNISLGKGGDPNRLEINPWRDDGE